MDCTGAQRQPQTVHTPYANPLHRYPGAYGSHHAAAAHCASSTQHAVAYTALIIAPFSVILPVRRSSRTTVHCPRTAPATPSWASCGRAWALRGRSSWSRSPWCPGAARGGQRTTRTSRRDSSRTRWGQCPRPQASTSLRRPRPGIPPEGMPRRHRRGVIPTVRRRRRGDTRTVRRRLLEDTRVQGMRPRPLVGRTDIRWPHHRQHSEHVVVRIQP